MLNSKEIALINKDIKSITDNKKMLLSLIILPLVMAIVLPSIFILVFKFDPESMKDFEPLLATMEINTNMDIGEKIVLELILNSIMPMFFLMIPIMASSIMAGTSFVGEKEKRTLETLLYSPLSLGQIFKAKVMASLLLGILISFISFIGMILIVGLEMYYLLGFLIFPGISWLIILGLVSPSLSLISITLIVGVSAKAETVEESQQYGVFLVLPIILLASSQLSGFLLISPLILLIIGIVLLIIGIFSIYWGSGRFKYERLLK